MKLVSGLILVLLYKYVLSAPSFVISEDGLSFLKDGEPFRIISGSIHYFRMHPSLFEDRLSKAKMGGLNTVQTYIPWNIHNPQPGVYNFTELEEYLNVAKEQGLLVVLRPGPYICGEWEFGGFPYWLLQQYPDITLRSSDPLFVNAVNTYYQELLPTIEPYLYSNGGNVILVQIENEYGSYGNDKSYLQQLFVILRKYLGDDVIIHSTDGNGDIFLLNSYIPGIYQTVDFGPYGNVSENFQPQHDYNKKGPYMNSEFYPGWLTHWNDSAMATVNATLVANYLYEILSFNNASVNMYMYYGGTNFGFMNGANGDFTTFQPQITSYDYDAPLTEAGDPTEKYFLIRNVIQKFAPVPSGPLPTPSKKGNYGEIIMTEQISLFAPGVLESPSFTSPIVTSSVYSFERLGLDYGFVLYRTNLTREFNSSSTLSFEPHDRASVFLDGNYVGLLYRGENSSMYLPPVLANTATLDILIENMGRINYGPALTDSKGIAEPGVLCDFYYLFGWTAYPLPLTNLSSLQFQPIASGEGPSFFRGTFNIQGAPMDTYFNMKGWTKGNVFINGFNLGRYWWIGPQYSLYVPSPVLRTGENEVIIFELEGMQAKSIISQSTSANV